MNTQRDVPAAGEAPAGAEPAAACAEAGAQCAESEAPRAESEAQCAEAPAAGAAAPGRPTPRGTDAVAPNAVAPDAVAPDAVPPDAAVIDTAATYTGSADTGATDPSAPDAPTPAPATPGARLRARREERGIGVQQVTDSLHIEPRLVGAMEADDFAVFDAPVYARGFLRKYASFLELPADEIVAGYDALHRGPDAPSLVPTASAAEPGRDWSAYRAPAVAAVAIAVLAGSYGWWMLRPPASTRGDRDVPAAAAQPIAPTAAAGSDGVAGPSGSGAPAATGVAGAAPAADPAPAPNASLASGSAAGANGVTTPASTVAGAGRLPERTPAVALAPPPRAAGRGVLEFRFTADCWVEVYGPAGERLLFDLARAGESRAVSGPGPWRVFVGYADGVRVAVGGRSVPIPAGGRRGATARFALAADGTTQ